MEMRRSSVASFRLSRAGSLPQYHADVCSARKGRVGIYSNVSHRGDFRILSVIEKKSKKSPFLVPSFFIVVACGLCTDAHTTTCHRRVIDQALISTFFEVFCSRPPTKTIHVHPIVSNHIISFLDRYVHVFPRDALVTLKLSSSSTEKSRAR